MPTFFVSEKSYSNNEETFLYISQQNLDDLLSNLRRFYHRTSEFKIYELRTVNPSGFEPEGCVPLGLAATVPFRDRITIYSNLYGTYLDDLPSEQFFNEVQRMKDYLDQKTAVFKQRQPAVTTVDKTTTGE